jgi:hypothetical protein
MILRLAFPYFYFHVATITRNVYTVDVEVEAKSFVPKVGHLGQREPVVQPATERKRIKQHVV